MRITERMKLEKKNVNFPKTIDSIISFKTFCHLYLRSLEVKIP